MSDSPPIEIDVSEARRLRESSESPLFLDVREPFEVEIGHLGPDLHLPLGTLSSRWEEIPEGRLVIVYCHHGVRSLRAAQFLRAKGLEEVRSLAGGIEAWSLRIDPSISRY